MKLVIYTSSCVGYMECECLKCKTCAHLYYITWMKCGGSADVINHIVLLRQQICVIWLLITAAFIVVYVLKDLWLNMCTLPLHSEGGWQKETRVVHWEKWRSLGHGLSYSVTGDHLVIITKQKCCDSKCCTESK